MVRAISILGIKNPMYKIKKKFKFTKRGTEIYDPEWKMTFESEKERKEFLASILEAEEDVRYRRLLTSEEMWNYFREEVGCDI